MRLDQTVPAGRRWNNRILLLRVFTVAMALYLLNVTSFFRTFNHKVPASWSHITSFKPPIRKNAIASETMTLASASYSGRARHIRHQSSGKNRSCTVQSNATSPYAYAFMIGGCNPDHPGYRGFLYNVLLAADILSEQGSTADRIVFIQMSPSYDGEELPPPEVRLLQRVEVQIRYIPKPISESFYDATLQKFRILTLTKYRRVLFLDADVLPVANLDFFFHLSDAGPESILRPNVVVAGPLEPSNAGLFMLQPGDGEYKELQEVMQKRKQKVKSMPGTTFDSVEGWGHVMAEPDSWRSTKYRGQNWTFQAAHGDQGLLYYWVKYQKKNASLICANHVETWSALPNGTVYLQKRKRDVLWNTSRPIQVFYQECLRWAQRTCIAPYDSFVHFTGRDKPWIHKPPRDISEEHKMKSRKYFWWWRLKKLNDKINIGVDIFNWRPMPKPSLGLFSGLSDTNNREE